MLDIRTVLSHEGVGIADVACTHPAGQGRHPEEASVHALVFVRRGCFIRYVGGIEALLDPTAAYCMNPGEEQRFDHPHRHGDDCTSLSLDESLLASIWGGEPTLPDRPLPVAPRLDVEHRLLLAAAIRGDSPHELTEQAIALTASALEQVNRRRVESGRPATTRARRALVDGVREALAADMERSLLDLAQTLAVSPHHLSRVFRQATGHTIARHRMRLRARAVLERLAGGERDLARLAADVGFADQSHLSRVIRSETGVTPSMLRRAIG
jgi:AraC-like DNA-binding protein